MPGFLDMLPPVWDNIIKKRVKAERMGGGGGPRHHHHIQRPPIHCRDDRLMKLAAAGESSQ